MKNNHLLAKIGQYALVSNQRGEVLVLERLRSKTWSLPGGRLNVGEECNKAFVREIKEETNLRISEFYPYTTNLITDPYQTKYCVYFITKVSNISDLRISPEHSNFKWVGIADLSSLTLEDALVEKAISDFLKDRRIK